MASHGESFFKHTGRRFLSKTAMLAVPFLFLFCGSTVRLNHAPVQVLAQKKLVAVVQIKIESVNKDSLFGAIRDGASTLSRALGGKDLKLPSTAKDDPEAKLEEFLASSVNRNLLAKGFVPIQRSKIHQVLDEQAFGQSGLTANRTRIGQMLKADAVFTGKLIVRESTGLDIPVVVACLFPILFLVRRSSAAELNFSGELTDVESGSLLLSGTASTEITKIRGEEFDGLVSDFFAELP